MAIPIRLLAGLENDIQVNLIAQSIDMTVERNISAFPTPNNYLKRFAIDTNTPRMTVEIHGIITDDEGINLQSVGIGESAVSTSPAKTLINFGSLLATEAFSTYTPIGSARQTSNGQLLNPSVTTYGKLRTPRLYRKESTNLLSGLQGEGLGSYGLAKPGAGIITDGNVPIQPDLKFTGAHSIGATGALNVETTLGSLSITDNPDLIGAERLMSVGDRVVNKSNTFIGIISALTSTTVTFEDALTVAISANDTLYISPKCFNSKNEFVGYVTSIYDDNSVPVGSTTRWYVQFSDVIETDLIEGEVLSFNQSNNSVEQSLHGEFIKIVPSYWLEDVRRNPIASLCKRDSGMGITQYGHIGIRFEFDANQRPTLLGGGAVPSIKYTTSSTSRVGGYVYTRDKEDAYHFDAVVLIPIKGIATTNGKNPAVIMASLIEDALQLTGNITNFSFKVNEQGQTLPDAFKVSRYESIVVIEQKYIPDNPVSDPYPFSPALRDMVQVVQADNLIDNGAKKSAGDKVQDLIGLVSNSNKNIDMFRGIQIPYDSLITSSGVTGIARNFFLTFGDIPATEKGALANTRSASELMNQMVINSVGGNIDDDDKEGLFDWIENTPIAGEIVSIFGFLKSVIEDTLVTLGTEAHGNDGGIRIMPEKLHVRYDAGNNYYAFTMLLVATDFVIGV
jgi:hypothetical protein